jgi:putative transposase
VAGLVSLRRRGLLTAAHVEGVATGLGVTGRSVWRWLSSADKDGRLARKLRPHFELNEADVSDLAYHFGNVAALHRERLQAGAEGPSLATLRRAVARQLSPGQRAGLSKGERARRDHDTYLTRKAGFRNECWEADHTELAIRAQPPDGSLVRPWLTLFVGLSTRAIPGWAVQAPAGGLGPSYRDRDARANSTARPRLVLGPAPAAPPGRPRWRVGPGRGERAVSAAG